MYVAEGIVDVEHRDKIIRMGSIHPEAISESEEVVSSKVDISCVHSFALPGLELCSF